MKTSSLRGAVLLFSLLLAASPFVATGQSAPLSLVWSEQPDVSIDLAAKTESDGPQPVARYMIAPLDEASDERRGETFKPYLHVYSPDGKRLLTKGPGGLYPHHRGIFYGFNKVTYGDGLRCDTWHCTGKAYQAHGGTLQRDDAGHMQASLTAQVDWHGAKGEVFAIERRMMQFKVFGDATEIVVRSELRSAGDFTVHLDGDPQHAGMHFRAAQEVADHSAKQTIYIRPDGVGQPGETRNWDHTNLQAATNPQSLDLPWIGMSIVVGGERFTVIRMCHPQNPKPQMHSERDYGRSGSYFVADATRDAPVRVVYAFHVVCGQATIEECARRYKLFVEDNLL